MSEELPVNTSIFYPVECFDCKIEEYLICAICKEVVRNPANLPSCPHLFCISCLPQNYNDDCANDYCPICRLDFEKINVHVNSYINNIVWNLPFKCIHQDKGCDWKGIIGYQERHLIDHLQTCKYEEMIDCPDCSLKVKLSEQKLHEKSCKNKIDPCEHCGESMLRKNKFIHQFIKNSDDYYCENREKCIYPSCKTKIPTGKKSEHLQNECTENYIICRVCDIHHIILSGKFSEHILELVKSGLSIKDLTEKLTRIYNLEKDMLVYCVEENSYPVILKIKEIYISYIIAINPLTERRVTIYNTLAITIYPNIRKYHDQTEQINDECLDCIKHYECSVTVTGKEYFIQPFFKCNTCRSCNNGNGFCAICAIECHDGHDVMLSASTGNFCDCGFNEYKNFRGKVIKCKAPKAIVLELGPDDVEPGPFDYFYIPTTLKIRGNGDVELGLFTDTTEDANNSRIRYSDD